jgi:hypothetical protein
MRIGLGTFLYIILIFSLTNCSSESNSARQASTVSENADVKTADSESEKPNLVAVNGADKIDKNAFNRPSQPETQPSQTQQKGEKSNVIAHQAPNDSEFSSSMDAKGRPIETRAFRNHPELSKVERIWETPRENIMKIHLKNGKIIEVGSDKLPNFRTDSPENILIAAGVKESSTPDPNRKASKKQ